MLKQIFILTGFLCLFCTFFSYGLNSDIEFKDVRGRWLVVDIGMQDGSCMLTCTGIATNTNLEYFFKNKTDLIITDLQNLNTKIIRTSIANRKIELHDLSESYDVERVGDTLVLLEYREKGTKDRLKKIKLLRRADFMKTHSPEYVGDTLVTDVYTCPILYKGFMTYLWSKVNVHRKHEFYIEGYFIINRKEETVSTVFKHKGTMKESVERKFRKAIAKSYKEWTFVENAPVYKIPFYGELKPSAHGKYGYLEFGKEKEVILQHEELGSNCDSKWLSGNQFNKGIKAFEKKKYEEAIKLFEEANALDPMNIDALYNAANIYLVLNQEAKACEHWTYLAYELKQMPAKKLLMEHCK